MDNLKKIDQHIRNLNRESVRQEIPDHEWAAIETGLKRKEFYTFSFFRWNAFFAAGICLNLLVSGFFLTDYFLKNSAKSEQHILLPAGKQDTTELDPRSSVSEDREGEFYKNPPIGKRAQKPSPGNAPVGLPYSETKGNHPADSGNIADFNHSAATHPQVQPPKDEKKNLPKDPPSERSKTVYIHQRDTIVEYDSVKVSPKKLRKLKQQ